MLHRYSSVVQCLLALFILLLPFGFSARAQVPVSCEFVALDNPAVPFTRSFGNRVSISGQFVIVSGTGTIDGPLGAAYIYEYVSGAWVLRQTLSDPGTLPGDFYANNVFIDGNTAFVAAYNYTRAGTTGGIGAVYVYTLQGTQWVKTGLIQNPKPFTGDFGWSLAKSGTDLVVGNSSSTTPTNTVYVYRQPGVTTQPWALVASLTAQVAATGYDYGYSVAINNDNLIVGAVDRFNQGRASAHFYRRTAAGDWQLAQVESYVSGTLAANSVGVYGNYAVIGTDSNKGVRIYALNANATSWQLRQTLFTPDVSGGRYGFSVSINRNVLLVGNPTGGDNPLFSGRVYRYQLRNSGWQFSRTYIPPQPVNGDGFGGSVALDRNSNGLIIGSPGRNFASGAAIGQAFVLWEPAIVPAGPLCVDAGTVALQATASGGTWAGPGIVDAQAGRFDPAKAGVGTHYIVYAVTAGGCAHFDTAAIVVKPAVRIARANLPRLTCLRDTTVTLTANVAGGTWAGAGIVSAQAGTFRSAVAGVGRHVVTYTLANTTYCNQQDTVSIVVGPVVVRAQAVLRRFSCARDTSFALSAAPRGGSWRGPGIVNAAAGTFSSAAAGPGRHLLTYSLAIGTCGGQDTLSVVVQPAPVRLLTAPPTLCRLDTMLQLSASPAGGTWRGAGITNAQRGLFSAATAGPGRHVVRYELGSGACRSADSVAVVISPAPVPVLSPAGPLTLRCGQPAPPLSVVGPSPAGTRYEWYYRPSPSAPWQVLATGNGQPTYPVAEAGEYRVRTTQGSCTALSAPVELRVEPAQTAVLPNVFTPNGDGLNDAFELKLQYPRSYFVQVFNRWGREVFSTNQYGDFWTGATSPAGAYYYLWRYSTDCESTQRVVKGWVELVR